MADQQPDTRGDRLDERGIVVTAAGRERARAKLAALADRWTPEQREERRRALLERITAA